MENQWNKSSNSEYTHRDVLRNSVADDISTENIDSARTERLIEKINRLCECAACFFCVYDEIYPVTEQTAILLITEGGMGYEREAYPYGSAQGSDP